MSSVDKQAFAATDEDPKDAFESEERCHSVASKPFSFSQNTSNETLLDENFDLKSKADLPGGCDVTSTHKTSATKTVQTPTNTAYVTPPVPFWREQKFWIQIVIMGIMQLPMVYLCVSSKKDIADLISCGKSNKSSGSPCADCLCVAASRLSLGDVLNIAKQTELKDMVNREWEIKKKNLEEDWSRKIEAMVRNMKNVTSEMKKMMITEVENLKKENKDTKDHMENKFDGVYGQFNVFSSEIGGINNSMIISTLVILIGGIILANIVITRQPLSERIPTLFGHKTKKQGASYNTIIEKLMGKRIEKGVLIISFDDTTHKFHRGIFEAVLTPKSLSVKDVVIKSFSDLTEVEPRKLVIIFVDANERHIILENPESEIGDFRNQTTNVFISLACDVFVVYCKDRGSQEMSSNCLYNPDLKSVQTHPILCMLKKKGRVFSIDEKFHTFQLSHLNRYCKELSL